MLSVETGRRAHRDAFICYTAADAAFVHEMIYKLENIHGLKLFIKERDMVAGGANNVMLAELVKSRSVSQCVTLSRSKVKVKCQQKSIITCIYTVSQKRLSDKLGHSKRIDRPTVKNTDSGD